MISLYSIPAAVAALIKVVIFALSRRAHLQTARATIFRVSVVLSVVLNLAEFAILQLWSNTITFNAVLSYYATTTIVVALLVHLAVSVTFDDWESARFMPLYGVLYGVAAILMAVFIFATPQMILRVEDLHGYTVTAIKGPLYWLYDSYVVVCFLSILLLPVFGLRHGRDENRRSRCKLWIVGMAPLVLLVLTIIILLQLDIRWFNMSVTSPLVVACAFAVIGYVVHKDPVIDINFYIPGTKTRKRKEGFYQQMTRLERDAEGAGSLQDLLNRIAQVLRCPVAVVAASGAALGSADASGEMLSVSLSQLKEIRDITSKDAEKCPSELRQMFGKSSVDAAIPFFTNARTLCFWLLCGEPFSRQIYSARDYAVLKRLIGKLSGLLLEKIFSAVQAGEPSKGVLEKNRAVAALPAPIEERSLRKQIEQIEAHCIRQALAESNGNKAEAARRLGVRPNTLHYKLRRYGITS